MTADDTRRRVTIDRDRNSHYTVTNARGGTITVGDGSDAEFSPVELLLTAIGGCTAIDVDLVTSRRAEPESFLVDVEATKVSDEHGHHLTDIVVTFKVAFPDSDGGQAARAVLPGIVRQSHERLCTVSRTVEIGTPITTRIELRTSYYFRMMSDSGLHGYCDALLWSLDSGDQAGFLASLQRIRQATPHSSQAEVQEAAARLTPLVATIPFWKGSDLASVAGQVTSYCADNSVILPALVRRTIAVMELSAWFAVMLHGKNVPDPEDPGLYQESVGLLRDVLSQPGRDTLPGMLGLPSQPDARAGALAEAWFSCRSWMQPVLYLAQRKDIRVTLPDRDRLTAACDAIREHMVTAEWLHGLLLVLDDETLVVLHRPTGLGYRVTISGIGDNFQLHTLLAAALIGRKSRGMIGGKAPSPAEVAAASDGPDLAPPGGIQGRFAMADAHGDGIWLEGRPADIPALEGTRVVVLDPPPYPRSWDAGRAYPQMRPSLMVDEILNELSSAYWLDKVRAPAW